MNKLNKSREQRRIDHQGQIIQIKNDKIKALESKISMLEISCEEKNELINEIDSLRKDMLEVVEDLKAKRKEYDRLMSELVMMRNAMDDAVFGGKWWLVKRLLGKQYKR